MEIDREASKDWDLVTSACERLVTLRLESLNTLRFLERDQGRGRMHEEEAKTAALFPSSGCL